MTPLRAAVLGLLAGPLLAAPQAGTQTAPTIATAPPPSDAQLKSLVQDAHDKFKDVKDGKNADYIPALAKVDSNLFGVAIVTVDGRVFTSGDTDHAFSIQSVSKPFVAARLMTEIGPDEVEKKIGVNATGQAFNSVTAIELENNGKRPPTGNPLVNAGAIATVGLLDAKSADDRWNQVSSTLNTFAGRQLPVDQEIYKSEAATNTHNKAIAELLQSYEVFKSNPTEALDVYTRQCSVAVTAKDLATMGATLANGGMNPVTHKQVVSPQIAEHVLAVMMTAGLYEDSGNWSYRVGVPAKSGVGGGIVAVVPGRYAVAAFSPPLDKAGNSVRSQKAIEYIVGQAGGNVFASRPSQRRGAGGP
jgi:glutaminase